MMCVCVCVCVCEGEGGVNCCENVASDASAGCSPGLYSSEGVHEECCGCTRTAALSVSLLLVTAPQSPGQQASRLQASKLMR